MSARKVVTPSFEILRNGGVLKVVPLRKARLLVGSDAGADLRLKHPAIAARHLEIAVVEGKFLEARNLAGPGKLHRAGEAIEVVRLREGDELDLGPVSLRLVYDRGGRSPTPVPQARRAAAEALPDDEEPTDADVPAPFRSPPPPAGQSQRAPFQDDDEPLAEAATMTMRALSREGQDAPTEAMTAVPRPPTPSLLAEPGLEEVALASPLVIELAAPGMPPVRVPLRVGSFDIGSGDCALRFGLQGLAPTHARLLVMPDGAVYLRHLAGPAHATRLGEASITYARWSPGDEARIGPMRAALGTPAVMAPAPARGPARPELARLEPVPPRPLYDEDSVSDVPPPFGSPFPYQPLPARPAAGTPVPPPAPTPAAAAAPTPAAAAAPTPAAAAEAVPDVAMAASPAPAPVAPSELPAEMVKVRRKSVPSAAAPSAPAPVPFLADDIEVDYRAPLWQRATVPAIVAALLGVIAFQFWAYNHKESAQSSSGPRVATGQAPDRGGMEIDQAGGGPMVVGDPRRGRGGAGGAGGQPIEYLGTGGAGGYGGATAYIDPANDWDPGTRARTYRTEGEGVGAAERATAPRIDSSAAAEAVDRAEDEAFADEKARARAAKAATSDEAAQNRPRTSSGGGWVEMKEVEAVIYRDRKKLTYCTAAARETNPRLSGVMWLTLTLSTEGRIRNATLEGRSTVGDDGLLQCLRRQLSTMSMPVPEGGAVTFSYPFELTN